MMLLTFKSVWNTMDNISRCKHGHLKWKGPCFLQFKSPRFEWINKQCKISLDSTVWSFLIEAMIVLYMNRDCTFLIHVIIPICLWILYDVCISQSAIIVVLLRNKRVSALSHFMCYLHKLNTVKAWGQIICSCMIHPQNCMTNLMLGVVGYVHER